jgi:competence protein ComEC
VHFSSPFSSSASLLAIPLAALGFQLVGVLLSPIASFALFFAAVSVLLLHRWKSPLRWLIVYACITVVYASWLAESALNARLKPSLEGENMVLQGFVSAMPQSFEQGIRYKFWVTACLGPECPLGQSLRLAHYSGFGKRDAAPPELLQMGVDLCLKVRLKRTLSPLNPYAFDAELRALEEGISASGNIRAEMDCQSLVAAASDERPLLQASWREQRMPRLQAWVEGQRTVLRDSLKRSLDRAQPDSDRLNRVSKATIIALVVGEQSAIPNTWWSIFNQTGVGHLMSISGLHITLFAGIALSALKALFRLPQLTALLFRCGLQANRLVFSGSCRLCLQPDFRLGYTGTAHLLDARSRGLGVEHRA